MKHQHLRKLAGLTEHTQRAEAISRCREKFQQGFTLVGESKTNLDEVERFHYVKVAENGSLVHSVINAAGKSYEEIIKPKKLISK